MRALVLGILLICLNSYADPVRTVDPEAAKRGFINLTTKIYDVPQKPDFIDGLVEVWEPELREKALSATPEERKKMIYDRYGLIEPGYENGGYPMSVAVGKDGISTNCFMCHGGKVQGVAIPGAPNHLIDLQTFAEDSAFMQLPPEYRVRPFEALGWMNLSRGVTNAFFFAGYWLQMRDKDLNVLPREEHHDFGLKGSDLDAPAWWTLKYKKRLYSDAFTPVNHRALMQFSLNPANDGQWFIDHEEEFKDILQWIDSVEAPKFTGTVNSEMASRGQKIFNNACAKCHGTYGADAKYPNLVISLASVKTDPERVSNGVPPAVREFYRDSWFGNYGKEDVVLQPKGYVAPNLAGIWASAPYFHNGSVPTLYHVLYPEKRPKVWIIKDVDQLDLERVGLLIEELDAVPESSDMYLFQKRRYFDTTKISKSNQGHLYPNSLNDQEKADVLEYLKTI